MVSEQDKERQRLRFAKASRHLLSREEEQQRKAAARQRQQARRSGPGRQDWRDDDEPDAFAKMARPKLPPPAPRPLPDDLLRATVTAVHAGRVELDCGSARVAHRLLLDPAFRLAVGDEVRCEATDGPLRIVGVEPARSWLGRPDPGNPHRELVLAANVDVGVITAAAVDPPLRPGLIDRLLLALQRGHIAPLVCVNKIDLLDAAGRERLDATLRPYGEQDVPVLRCSAATGEGIAALRAFLAGRTCVFVGHSGVGKSSLLNELDPDGARPVGDVRAFDGKGRHTTTGACLRVLGDGTKVIDTPGIRAFGFDALTRGELAAAFPEVTAVARRCRFGDCAHAQEPDCAVRAAVASGELSAARFAAFLRLAGEVQKP